MAHSDPSAIRALALAALASLPACGTTAPGPPDGAASADDGSSAHDASALGVPPGPSCALPIAGDLAPSPTAVSLDPDRHLSPGWLVSSCLRSSTHYGVFHFRLASPTGIDLRLASLGADVGRVALSVRRACGDPGSEAACALDFQLSPSPAEPRRYARIRTVLDAGDWYVLAQFQSPVPRAVSVTLDGFDPAPNVTCASALLVGDGTVLGNQSAARGGQPTNVCHAGVGGPRFGAPPLFYVATVPPGRSFAATAGGTGASLRLGCSGECSPHATVSYANRGETEQTVYLTLESGSGDLRTFIAEPPPNSRAETATRVADGTTLSDQNPLFDDDGRCPEDPTRGRHALFYVAAVPPGGTLRVAARASRGFAWTPEVALRSTGGGTMPLPSSGYLNTDAVVRDVAIVVGGCDGDVGLFDLSVTIR